MISKMHKIGITVLSLCLILPLGSASAAIHTPTTSSKQTITSTPVKKAEKKVVKKIVKKEVVKKVVKKAAKKEVKKEVKKPAPQPVKKPALVEPVPTTQPDSKADPVAIPTPPVKPTAVTYNVSIEGFAFVAPELKIKIGDKVTFTQKDSTPHTVDTDPHPDHTQLPGFDSGTLSFGQTYTHTFIKAGTFTYHCSPHPSMKGKIIVEE